MKGMKDAHVTRRSFIGASVTALCGAAAVSRLPSGSAQAAEPADLDDDLLFIAGGTCAMGSPADEDWRGADETLHTATVGDFYLASHEVTQEEYEALTSQNPSKSTRGPRCPVDSVSWYDAVTYCNLLSEVRGLAPAYQVDGPCVRWDRSANGYRLPTEAEWEYACRAGSVTPFSTQGIPSADEANFYGHYPYLIENDYFTQENLATKPGVYREGSVEVESFAPNSWGLYDMHGNVGEWVWDYLGPYEEGLSDPTGASTGTLRVNRGGGWNDFGKHTRSAYRSALDPVATSPSLGFRVARSASLIQDVVGEAPVSKPVSSASETLLVYFSWSGNTQGIAAEIAAQTGLESVELVPVDVYGDDYDTVIDRAWREQNQQARPPLAVDFAAIDSYGTILLGFPTWWASIPMPVATFLESYDFAGKRILPFCSHGGGGFGQTLSAISKLVPLATVGEGLSIHYSGGASLAQDVQTWLATHGLSR